MNNEQIAAIFEEMADLTELKGGDPFRVRAYREAGSTIRGLGHPLATMVEQGEDLSKLPGIGKKSADKIKQILKTGTTDRVEELRLQVPASMRELLKIPDVGPKTAQRLLDELGVDSIETLRLAAEEGRIRDIPGFGVRKEEKILRGLNLLESVAERRLLSDVRTDVEAIEAHLATIPSVTCWEVAGSWRRRRDTIGDIDVVVCSSDKPATTKAILAFDRVSETIGKGEDKAVVRLDSGLRVDFQYADKENYGTTLLYLTGSRDHTVSLRGEAHERGWLLNEKGLFDGKEKRLAGRSEEEVYKVFGYDWIPPELRENSGEFEAARERRLPRLVEIGDITGDFHCHTTASDGTASIRDMAEAAIERGYKFLGITDHSKAVRVANGLDETRLRAHVEEIRRIDRELGSRIHLLAGVEVDILGDGRLDFDATLLSELDIVIGSVHSAFSQNEARMTKRVLRAVESGQIHALGHMLGRKIGHRERVNLNTTAVFKACAEAGVAIEINGQPDRLDLPAPYCRIARDAGCRFILSSDGHSPHGLGNIEYATGVARRGWLENKDIVNAMTWKSVQAWLDNRVKG